MLLSLKLCSCTTWFLDFDDSVRINRGWLCREPQVSVLQANAKLVQRGECWTWNQRSRGSTFCHWHFCFHIVKHIMSILALLPTLYNMEKIDRMICIDPAYFDSMSAYIKLGFLTGWYCPWNEITFKWHCLSNKITQRLGRHLSVKHRQSLQLSYFQTFDIFCGFLRSQLCWTYIWPFSLFRLQILSPI